MTKHNTASFLALADLSETLAIAALDELNRRKDGDAVDSFMAAVLIDRDAFAWFLKHEEFRYSRPKALEGENDFVSNTGFQVLLDPIKTRANQPEFTPWQVERLEKTIQFGLALPDPTRWMTLVANHLAAEAADAKSIGILQSAIERHNAPAGTAKLNAEPTATVNILQAAIDRQSKGPCEIVALPAVDLAIECCKYRNNHEMATVWLSGMGRDEFKKQEEILFSSLGADDHMTAFQLTMINAKELPEQLVGLKNLYAWLDENADPERMADLRISGMQRFLSGAPNAEIVEHFNDFKELLGMHKPASQAALKQRLLGMMENTDSNEPQASVDVLEHVVGKNLTELFPLIDTHPMMSSHPESNYMIGLVMDNAFGLVSGPAGAERFGATLDLLEKNGMSMVEANHGKNAFTHLASSQFIRKPEKLAVLLGRGLDPETPDSQGNTAQQLLKSEDVHPWNHVLNAFKARTVAHDVLQEISAHAAPRFMPA